MDAIAFGDEDVERLAYERFHHPHLRVQRKPESSAHGTKADQGKKVTGAVIRK